jgi:hypothetical protein
VLVDDGTGEDEDAADEPAASCGADFADCLWTLAEFAAGLAAAGFARCVAACFRARASVFSWAAIFRL